MTIQQKFILWPIVTGSILILVILLSVNWINQIVDQLLEVEIPRTAAVYELEINIEEASTEVLLVGQVPDDSNITRYRFEDAVQDFEINFLVYETLLFQQNIKHASDLKDLATSFIETGRAIFGLNEQLRNKLLVRRKLLHHNLDNVLANIAAFDNTDPKAFEKQKAALEIELNMQKLFSSVRGYLLKEDNDEKLAVSKALQGLDFWITEYSRYAQSRFEREAINRVKHDAVEIKALSIDIIKINGNIKIQLQKFKNLYRQIDSLLDDTIQIVEQQKIQESSELLSNVVRVSSSIILLIIILISYALYKAMKPLVRHIKALQQSAVLFKEEHQIAVPKATNDELGSLTNNLHEMMLELKESEETLKKMAHYDALTKLPNRSLLYERLTQLLHQNLRHPVPFAVGFIDLDGFKKVNDTFGHEVGDQLLINIASKTQKHLRLEDTLARVGGDEFIIVLQHIQNHHAALAILERIREMINKPVLINSNKVQVSASIGVKFSDDSSIVSPDALIKEADMAMYEAKTNGKNNIVIVGNELTIN